MIRILLHFNFFSFCQRLLFIGKDLNSFISHTPREPRTRVYAAPFPLSSLPLLASASNSQKRSIPSHLYLSSICFSLSFLVRLIGSFRNTLTVTDDRHKRTKRSGRWKRCRLSHTSPRQFCRLRLYNPYNLWSISPFPIASSIFISFINVSIIITIKYYLFLT